MERLKQAWRGRSLREWLEWALLGALAALLLRKGVAVGWAKLNTDFPNYYLVARLLHEGYSVDRIYDWVWLQRIKDHWGLPPGHVGFVGLTPFSAWALLPLAGWPALSAKRIWIVFNLLFLGASAELLYRTNGAQGLGRRWTWILVLLASSPLRSNFAFGQMHLLVLLLIVLAFYCERWGRPVACGVCLGLAGALKVYPLLFAAYFAWKRRWREVLAMAGCIAAVVAVGYLWMGHGAIGEFLQETVARVSQGEIVDPYNVHPGSASALLHRLFVFEPALNPFPVVRATWLYAVLYPLWQSLVLFPIFAMLRPSSKSGDRDQEALEWAAFLAMLLLLSPVPASYHFVVLIGAAVPLVNVLWRRGQRMEAAAAAALYVLICATNASSTVPEHFSPAWITSCNRLWLQMLLWAGLVFYLWRERGILAALRGNRPRALLIAAPFAVFWIWGFGSYQHHFAGLETDYARRIALPNQSLLSTRPVPRRGGFLYTAMTAGGGYAVVDQSGQALPIAEEGDTLSAAVHGATTLVEVAGRDESHLVQIPEPTPEMGAVLSRLENAEAPVFSPDGTWVAYIHEEEGRGSLWEMHVQGGQTSAATLLELAPRGSDVRGAAFLPSGDVLFSGTINGRSGIYSIPATRSREPQPFVLESDPTDSPAVSPDGRWVAFRTQVNHRWQLTALEVASHRQRRLTSGDCDAYTPAWLDRATILYATDCGRGVGLTALAKVRIDAP